MSTAFLGCSLTVWFPLSAPVFYFSYLWRTPEEKAARPDSNRSHLLKLWGVAGAFGALILVGLVAALASGQYTLPVLGLVMVPIVLILIRAKQRRLRRLLRRANPELILEYMAKETRGLKWVPHGDCLSAGTLASAAATLGDFDRARRELAAVSWDGRPPLYQGLRDSAAALLALLEERNPEKALALARQARSLSHVSGPFPSANRSRAALDATVAAAELLSGEHTPDLVATVEAMARQLPEIQKALPVCALGVHYAQQGDRARADQYRSLLLDIAPHARPLIELAGGLPSASGPHRAARTSWVALLRSLALPGAVLGGLVGLLWALPPDRHEVRHSRPVVISSPAASDGVTPSTTGPPADPAAVPAMIREARSALDEGEDDRAIGILDQVLRVSPEHGDALFYRAYAYDNKRNHVKAIQDLDRALRLRPEDAAALDNRGIAYLALGDFDRAIRDFDDAIRLDPANALAHNNRGRAYLDKEDYERAIQDFDEALRLRPGFKEASENRERARRRKYTDEHPIRTLLSAFR